MVATLFLFAIVARPAFDGYVENESMEIAAIVRALETVPYRASMVRHDGPDGTQLAKAEGVFRKLDGVPTYTLRAALSYMLVKNINISENNKKNGPEMEVTTLVTMANRWCFCVPENELYSGGAVNFVSVVREAAKGSRNSLLTFDARGKCHLNSWSIGTLDFEFDALAEFDLFAAKYKRR